MAREENIRIFEDTVKLCNSSARLKESIKKSQAEQVLTLEKDAVEDGSKAARFEEEAKIIVSKKRSFEAAKAYCNGLQKVCVLNFASSTNPGGGVSTGAGAQEECLCRISTLYFCLDTDVLWKKFYKPHRELHSPIHNDDILYTPNITVFKTDTAVPKLTSENEWYTVDVITCAAPNLRERPSNRYNSGDGQERLALSDSELEAVHKKRDRRIFDVAVKNGVDVLILGAFGCGAFRNKPEIVAKVMLGLAHEYSKAFKVIEFAVYCPPYDDSNYKAFLAAGDML